MVAPPETTRPAWISDFSRLRESSGKPPASSLSSLSPASWGAARTVRPLPLFDVTAMTTDLNQNARLLKAVVIGLGVLILVAVGLIVYVIVGRAVGDGQGSSDDYVSTSVNLPAGSRVVGMTADDDVLSLLIEDADARQRVMTIDRRSGAVLGILTLEPE